MDNFVQEFLVETNEYIEQIDQDLLTLEREGSSRDVLARIFRSFHSIKGCAQFLGFAKLGAVSHVGESLLSNLRDDKLKVTPEIITGMLAVTDATREMLASIGETGKDGENSYSELIDNILKLEKGLTGVMGSSANSGKPNPQISHEPSVVSDVAPAKIESDDLQAPQTNLDSSKIQDDQPSMTQQAASVSPEKSQELPAAPVAEKPRANTEPAVKPKPNMASSAGGNAPESTVRVDVGLLDRLMTLVGELVLARNQILQCSTVVNRESPALYNATQRLDAITTDLQEGMMKTRMQPIRNVWTSVPRVVRDLCQMTGKKVRVEMEGELTELDKTVLEAIKDPITHMVRNSVDHGVESPDKRIQAGKPEEGTLTMRAWHEGGQVNIELTDDGAGIDPERVKRKAVERGIIRADQAARMSDREAINLIFRPGFSTAESLTMISGRGVGMDVVKSSIEAIGGSVDVESLLGFGSTMKMRIPLTLAILKALIIVARGERYAIPQVNLVEIIRLESANAASLIEELHGVHVCRYRGRLLPIVNLNRALGLEEGPACQLSPAEESDSLNIVILQADRAVFGLAVDRIVDPQEIVVRPLAKALRGIEPLAGATIMGDGRVALILDVFGLARVTNVIAERMKQLSALGVSAGPAAFRSVEASAEMQSGEVRRNLLLMRALDGSRQAISLESVRRIEVMNLDTIEFNNGVGMVNYRGKIIHVFNPVTLFQIGGQNNQDSGLNTAESNASRQVHVVVFSDEQPLGLMFESVIDIVRESVSTVGRPRHLGAQSTIIVGDELTDVVDIARTTRLTSVYLSETGLQPAQVEALP